MSRSQEVRKIPSSFDKIQLEQTTEPPQFNHEEVNIFYEKSFRDFEKEQIEKIIALPRKTLIEDLETVLEDTCRRNEHFNSIGYSEETHQFQTHALYFLGALESENSLQKILNLLRMGEEFREFWFSDWVEHIFTPVLYAIGKNQLPILSGFAKEKNIVGWNKSLIPSAVMNIAVKNPERRAEVIHFFEDLFNFFLENEDDEDLIDTDFIGSLIAEAIHLRAVELLPLIEKMDEKKWLDYMHVGDMKEISQDINKPFDPFYDNPMPKDIFEYYSESYLRRRQDSNDIEDSILEVNKNKSKGEKLIEQFKLGNLFSAFGKKQKEKDLLADYKGYGDEEEEFIGFEEDDHYSYRQTTVKRVGKKVGRNDPCPCGSGKKYKKCCL